MSYTANCGTYIFSTSLNLKTINTSIHYKLHPSHIYHKLAYISLAWEEGTEEEGESKVKGLTIIHRKIAMT